MDSSLFESIAIPDILEAILAPLVSTQDEQGLRGALSACRSMRNAAKVALAAPRSNARAKIGRPQDLWEIPRFLSKLEFERKMNLDTICTMVSTQAERKSDLLEHVTDVRMNWGASNDRLNVDLPTALSTLCPRLSSLDIDDIRLQPEDTFWESLASTPHLRSLSLYYSIAPYRAFVPMLPVSAWPHLSRLTHLGLVGAILGQSEIQGIVDHLPNLETLECTEISIETPIRSSKPCPWKRLELWSPLPLHSILLLPLSDGVRVKVNDDDDDGWDPYPVGNDVDRFARQMQILAACDDTDPEEVLPPCLVHESTLPRGMISAMAPRIATGKLTKLVLNCVVVEATVNELVAANPDLMELYLDHCQVSPGAWVLLRRLEKLRYLWIATDGYEDDEDDDPEIEISIGVPRSPLYPDPPIREIRHVITYGRQSGHHKAYTAATITGADVFEYLGTLSGICTTWRKYKVA